MIDFKRSPLQPVSWSDREALRRVIRHLLHARRSKRQLTAKLHSVPYTDKDEHQCLIEDMTAADSRPRTAIYPNGTIQLPLGRRSAVYQPKRPKEADFIPVVVWDKEGETCANYLNKTPVAVDGRLQVRSYDAQDGSRRWVTEVVAQDARFLDRGRQSDQEGGAPRETDQSDDFLLRMCPSNRVNVWRESEEGLQGRRKVCNFCVDKVDMLTTKKRRLRRYLSERGRYCLGG